MSNLKSFYRLSLSPFHNYLMQTEFTRVCDSRSILSNIKTSLFDYRLRFLSSPSSSSTLSTLRKKTGYAFVLCRKALEQNDNDLNKAEKWLRAEALKQGWEKAEQIKSRTTGQGLIGIYTDPTLQKSTIIEVKCETDFVAKNQNFVSLVTDLAKLSAQIDTEKTEASVEKIVINDEQKLNEISGNRLVESINKLGENIRFLRACIIKTNQIDIRLLPYAHAVASKIESNDINVQLGKYGTIIAVRPKNQIEQSKNDLESNEVSYDIQELGARLGQHIIGLSPKSVLREDDTGEKLPDDINGDEEPTDLLRQKFLLNEDITVKQFVDNSNVEVLDFIRFECGE
ncbi:Elongation factor Ts [Sarcoptes scabiei]|uniref:Elongation factor Ts, mitochondrial n=1 Tax=Sarcoptes scabiei TaxID=52283 RepID=A0A834R8G7_SARSC|nr:Elongation factor Ts [Sarcoptes scabiei]